MFNPAPMSPAVRRRCVLDPLDAPPHTVDPEA